MLFYASFVAVIPFFTLTLASPTPVPAAFNPAQYNHPDNGTPTSLFTGSPSVPTSVLVAAAKKGTKKRGTYELTSGDSSRKATIYGDWASFSSVGAYFFTANMNVDCDGIDYKCKNNPDGQPQTDYGALAAYAVPWIVLPNHFATSHSSQIPGNNVAAVICNGNLFYAIFGDSNGDSPESIGEASWLLAHSCFPNENLNGGAGHNPADVTYIVFTGSQAVLPSSALDKNYITNYSKLRSMGNSLLGKLVKELNL